MKDRTYNLCLLVLLLLGMLAGRPALAAAPFLLVVYASGGWDQTLVFDYKGGKSSVAGEAGQSQATAAGGLTYVDHPSRSAVATFFNAYGDHAAIVNGLFVGGMDRASAQSQLFTLVPAGKTRPTDWVSLYADGSGFSGDLPHLIFSAPYAPGDLSAAAVPLGPSSVVDYQAATAPGDPLGDSGESALTAFRSLAMSRLSDNIAAGSLDSDKVIALQKSYARDAKISVQLQAAVKTVGAQGSDDTFVYQAKLAIECFSQGASIAATIQAGAPGLWDSTTDNFAQQSVAYQTLFTDLKTVLDYAASHAALKDQLTVVVMSESGRAPLLNAAAGKGPWPYTSLLLWGAGITGGAVAGMSDDQLRAIPVDPIFGGTGKSTSVALRPGHVWTALYTKAGIATKPIVGDTPPLSSIIK